MELKKKSISVHTVTTIVLAVLLALSLMLGLSGAWFTDKASANKDVTFGQINIGTSLTITVPENVLPTQKITITNPQYIGEAAYYRISIGVTNVVGGTATEQELNELLGASTIYGSIGKTATLTDVANFPSEISIPAATDNKFQNVTCKLVIVLDVIQQEGVKAAAGLADDAVLDSTETGLANWAKIFEVCTDFANGTAKA